MYAAYNNHTGCVRVLLEHGADITIENEEGLSAMDLAVGQSHKAGECSKNLSTCIWFIYFIVIYTALKNTSDIPNFWCQNNISYRTVLFLLFISWHECEVASTYCFEMIFFYFSSASDRDTHALNVWWNALNSEIDGEVVWCHEIPSDTKRWSTYSDH